MKNPTREQAMAVWSDGTEINTRTDFETNDLLEEIAGKRYDIYEQDDDPIYTIIGNLTASERRRFIKGVRQIIGKERARA